MAAIKRQAQTAMEKFTSKFDLPKRPGDEIPEIPELDDLSDADLMTTYSQFMAWVSYAKAEFVQAEILEERAAHNLRLAESTSLIGQWDAEAKGDRVTIAKARRDAAPQVVSLQEKHLEARAYRKLVESVYDRCDRSAQVLSRELSRRIGMNPKERQTNRYGGG